MKNISGVLNVYFPFELKKDTAVRNIQRAYNRIRSSQIKRTRYMQHPRTDLMDKECMRKEAEDMVAIGQKLMGGMCEAGFEPYATSNIRSAYHKDREDNYFVEEPSVKLSCFDVICQGVNNAANPMTGQLFYFNNLTHHVGTYLLALKFQNLSLDEALRLKHVFYKRALVDISETLSLGTCISGHMTFQDYVSYKALPQSYRRKTDIDSRARYTFLEIEDSGLNDSERFALLCANEKYEDIKKKKVQLTDYSSSRSYSLYYNLRSALIINHKYFNKVLKRQKYFFKKLSFDLEMIPVEVMSSDKWIAGLDKGKFPEFLKTVEIYLLTNNIRRHETVRHRISYYNPIVMVRRRYKLWQIIYAMDMSHCYINKDMLEAFEVNENLKELKDEYSQLNNHIINYTMIALTIGMAFIALLPYIR